MSFFVLSFFALLNVVMFEVMKRALKWIRRKIERLFVNVDDVLFRHIDEAITITESLKRLVKLPATTVIVTLTPTDVDNKVAEVLNKTMDDVLSILQLVPDCQYKDTYQLRLRCFVEALRAKHPELQHAIYLKIASLFLRKRSERVLSEVLADSLIQNRKFEIDGE